MIHKSKDYDDLGLNTRPEYYRSMPNNPLTDRMDSGGSVGDNAFKIRKVINKSFDITTDSGNEYNTFNHNYLRGIDIISSTYTYVIYSDLNFNELGVDAYYSPNTTINNNVIIGNMLDGIYLVDSPYSRVMGNHVEENGVVGLNGVPWVGIEMENSDSSNVTNNNLIMNGINIKENSLSEYQSYDLSFNDVNGLPYGFFVDEVGVTINSPIYGQLFLVNCSDSSLNDLTFNFASIGIKLVYCERTSISSISSVNGLYGIHLVYTDDTYISSSSFDNNYIGLWAQNCYLLEVHNCFIRYNTYDGCTLQYVSNSTFADNRIAFNDFNGIQLAWGDYNLFTLNLFQQNYNYGLKLAYAEYNIIHYNTFFENNLAGYYDGMFTGYAQGYDTKTTNTWYHDVNLEGNWWSDWSGTGSYVLDGRLMGPNEDLYPLGGDPPVPILSEYRRTLLVFIPIVMIPVILKYFRRKKR